MTLIVLSNFKSLISQFMGKFRADFARSHIVCLWNNSMKIMVVARFKTLNGINRVLNYDKLLKNCLHTSDTIFLAQKSGFDINFLNFG